MMDAPLLEIDHLDMSLNSRHGRIEVLRDVSLTVEHGEAVGLVGESGSGKSMTLRSVIGLLPRGARIDGGDIRFEGRSLVKDPGTVADIRGTGISMVFQEPAVALNPIMTVGRQIADGMREHLGLSKKETREHAIDLMEKVGITDAAHRVDSYPFELSGGMRQRVMIASAIACHPKLILCDEPTTALDVTVQRQVIDLLVSLCRTMDVSLLYVTHDMAVVANLCDRVTVLYSGSVMEQGSVRDLFSHPRHPYTAAMMRSTPLIDGPVTRLESIPGTAPLLSQRPKGCPFAPRCAFAVEKCSKAMPPLMDIGQGRSTACIRSVEVMVDG